MVFHQVNLPALNRAGTAAGDIVLQHTAHGLGMGGGVVELVTYQELSFPFLTAVAEGTWSFKTRLTLVETDLLTTPSGCCPVAHTWVDVEVETLLVGGVANGRRCQSAEPVDNHDGTGGSGMMQGRERFRGEALTTFVDGRYLEVIDDTWLQVHLA